MFSQTGVSSLMVASFNGHVVVVDKLLQHGATVDLQHNVMPHTHMKYKLPQFTNYSVKYTSHSHTRYMHTQKLKV